MRLVAVLHDERSFAVLTLTLKYAKILVKNLQKGM